ncbi:MAG: CBS domain-containing protein [Fuerstiella sp.]|nr:CBS domain-containing protein [Fuerstiella sp.]
MGLKEDLDTATVSQMNIRPPVTIPRTATVRDAVDAMRFAGLGCAIVVDNEKKAVGIFTEGMLRHALNESVQILNEGLESQMVARLPWVRPTDPVKMVLEAMEEHNIRFIAVLDDDRRVIGITGQKTLMEFIAEYFPREVFTQDPTGVTTSHKKEGA